MIEINKIYATNNFGDILVIKKGSKKNYYTIKFLETGTIKDVRSYQIKMGCVRDPYAINVCNVACTGNIKTKGKNKVFYSIWHDMINRCYNKNDKRYNSYKNVSVCKEWLVFENFYNDIKYIDGFDEELIRKGVLVLDKDIKQRFEPKKIYSVNTCTWIRRETNNKIQDSQQKPFYALSPDGLIYKSTNITEFAIMHGLCRKNISAVLHNRNKTVKGWRFSYKEIV